MWSSSFRAPSRRCGIQSEDYEIYALSNGNADVARIGLGHVFTCATFPPSAWAPPSRTRMYRAAIAAGVAPHEVLHIGDHPEQDVASGRRSGHEDRLGQLGGQPWPALSPADGEIRHFDELPDLVRRLTR